MRAILLIIVAGLALVAAGCSDENTAPGGSGFIEANEVVVSAETAGRIVQRFFSEGTQVAAGDTLTIIDPSRLELELASAMANRQALVANLQATRLQVDKARETEQYASSERDRVAKLVASGAATRKQMDQLEHEATLAVNARQTAQANVSVTEAQIAKLDADIARMQRQLQDAYVIAPMSGMVTEDYVEIGEVVNPGKAIVKISSLDTVWVKVYLPASQFSTIKIGDRANISTEAGEQSYAGTVIWTSEEAEFTPKNVQTVKSRTNLVYAVKVSIPNSDGKLKIGMPVFVTLGQS